MIDCGPQFGIRTPPRPTRLCAVIRRVLLAGAIAATLPAAAADYVEGPGDIDGPLIYIFVGDTVTIVVNY